MKISDIMTKKPHLIEENTTVLEASKKMQSLGCGILPVGDINHIKGIITDRDIITRVIAKEKSITQTLVKDIMTKEVVFCDENAFLQNAIYQMNQHNMRRVLAKNKNEQLSGILSLGDIIRRVLDKSLLATLFTESKVA